MNHKIRDLSGQVFGRLTVTNRYEKRRHYTYWICRCECGNEKSIRGTSLTMGHTLSCGCLQKELAARQLTIHGFGDDPIYIKWVSMLKRCQTEKGKQKKSYGARGIKVCERWQSFDNFLADMGPSYFDGASLERNDVNGNYELSNCTWIPLVLQARNKTTSVFLDTPWGRLNVSIAAKKIGINYSSLINRMLNWPREKWFVPNQRNYQRSISSL